MPSLARRIVALLAVATREERSPQIVLDLDGTLFDNVPRTKRILLDRVRRLFGDDSELAHTIEAIPETSFQYNPIDTLRSHGVADEELLTRIREEWAEDFFGGDYLVHDQPLAGAVDAASSWWNAGAEINYLTGRHVPQMFLGTCRSLHDAGFPIGTIRTQLLMKPIADADDVEFKVGTVPALRRKGSVVLLVDNDPRVLNPLSEAIPEAIPVMVKTLHPANAPALREEIAVVRDFRELVEIA
jgi:hypothetical protein